MKTKEYVEYMVKQAVDVLDIDSPTGFTKNAAEHIIKEYKKLGFEPKLTTKGGVIVDLGGKDSEDAILVEAHMDTLGGMVCKIKDNGNLELTPLGGFSPNNGEAENCRIYTREGKVYEGTFQLNDASVHVNDDYKTTAREFKSMEVVIDEEVSSADDTKKLGIMIGDIVAFEPRTRVTKSGYIKSRFLDDKLSVGILLGQAKYLADNKITPERKLFHHITVYEEVGHGACGTVPEGVTEILSVDMGCIGEGLDCKETQVSICAKDSAGPYNYDVVSNLIKTAKDNKIDFAVDVYPHYGSDADAALNAGYDVRHGLIGAGVYASHGYERSHKKGVENTFKLLINYIK
ncbi:M42 family metallopeptidase [Pseudobutyrivibrio sp.]|uniref:M42 family metallopeptidase n=1 Tax=Pseudobutyrivibrio sp. TaxID=2014367 RepID=UPI0025D005F8|nr:M42 family metallopeptidase [Pseudobutyrivibrio sp.]MBR5649003.1 M42 family metallopeptidase [Pseudobutyrivibrio sp.]